MVITRLRRVFRVSARAKESSRLGLIAGSALLVALLPQLAVPAAAQDASQNAADTFANVTLPPGRGQADLTVFVPQTGHSLRGTMLDYWRANGAADVYGNPISEPYAASNGYYSQAFQNAVFQFRPEYADTEDPVVRLEPIGDTVLHGRLDTYQRTGRRGAGGGDRRATAWTPLQSDSQTASNATQAGGTFDQHSGHTISGPILDWYKSHEGGFYLGAPLSEPVRERGITVQYFEGALLMATDGRASLAPLAEENAARLGIATKPVPQGDVQPYSESLFQNVGVQPSEDQLDSSGQAGAGYLQIVGDLKTPGRHWIEVDLSKEQLWAYQGNTVVMTTPVSTGLAPNTTLPGVFHVRLKFPQQTMDGFTDNTGEVNGFGDTPPDGGGNYWRVSDVPNVMYFSVSAEALHGAYWHNNFGNPMSHGCVNLPLEVAQWMYGWAPLGTEVWIHE